MNQLAELGGALTGDDDVIFEGTQFKIPQKMDLTSARDFLSNRIQADEEETRITRRYDYRPPDGHHAAWKVIRDLFGIATGQATYDFFGKNPPELHSIPVAVDRSEQIPGGWVAVPLLEQGKIGFGSHRDPEKGLVTQLAYEGPRKYRFEVEGLFAAVEKELTTNSIYLGQAINGREIPEFLDLSGVDPKKVVYSQSVIDQLDGNVWSVIEHTDRMRELGISRKRAVLFSGPYGTGKTLASQLTAQKAVQNGWTFLQCRPGRDSLRDVMQTASLYQPAVVFFEDVDIVAEGESTDKDAVSELLDIFDGMTTKGTEILVVLTTNHVEKIHRGMLRPGRLDAVIQIDALDDAGIEKLCKVSIPDDMLDAIIEWPAVCTAMAGFLPAFVVESATRALRYSIARGDGKQIETSDLVMAAEGIRPQLDLMEGAGEGKQRPALDEALAQTVSDAARNVLANTQGLINGDPMIQFEESGDTKLTAATPAESL